jgi:replication factor C large subunit
MTTPLSEKYRPNKFSEIMGQNLAIDKLKAFFNSFNMKLAKKKAILLYGPPGTGKTTLAHVLAKEVEYELFELNASDLRNRAKLDEILKPSTLQKSLFSKGKIILVDEADGITSTEYGGLAELIALIEKTKFPMVITANDIWQQKFALLRQKCELVALKEVAYEIILEILKKILEKEVKNIELDLLKSIAAKSRGDLRAALNDLQSVIYNHNIGEFNEKDIGEREKNLDIFNAMKNIFKCKTTKETTEAYDNVQMETDQISLWLEKNIPLEYHGEDLVRAFEALSKADIFKGRIYRQQHWRFMEYQNFFLTAGISAARRIKSNAESFTKYQQPTRILKIWMNNQNNARKKTIAEKYAEYTHTSRKRAMKDFFLISLILNNESAKKLDLSEQEKDFLEERKNSLRIMHGLNRFAEKKV